MADSRWGRVVVDDLASESAGMSPDVCPEFTGTKYTWFPAEVLQTQVYLGFCLQLVSVAGEEGTRRFLPAEGLKSGLKAFLLKASLGGLAILSRTRNLTGEQRSSYDAMRLLYQKAPRVRESLSRAFQRARELCITAPERVTQDAKDVLPEHLGLNQDGSGVKWSVPELMDHGRTNAMLSGEPDPDAATCIRLGILEAAQRNPIEIGPLTDEQASALIRTTVFDFGPAEARPDGSTTEQVIERLLGAMQRHLDDTTDEFHAWFFEQADTLIRQIEKQRKGGGPVPRAVVRQVILETIFRSFGYVGDCVDLQMRAFAQALPTVLTERESELFEAVYQKQPALGGLPPILLADHSDLLRHVVSQVLQDATNPPSWGVVLRALEFHAEMVRNKRASERHYKSQRRDGTNKNASAFEAMENVSLVAAPIPVSPAFADLQELAAELRETRQACCRCGTTSQWHADLDVELSSDTVLVFFDSCPDCEFSELVTLPAAEAASILRRLQDFDDDEGRS